MQERGSEAADRLIEGGDLLGRTDALLVLQHGDVVLERYGAGVSATDTLRSWSMAKSMLHAAVGILVAEGRLDPAAPAPVPQWSAPDDPRSAITLWDLLTMRPGLEWTEDYVDGEGSDVIRMLFARDWEPVEDTAAFAAGKPLVADPGTQFNYSSGTSNIVAGIVRDVVGAGPAYGEWLRERLFGPLSMSSAIPKFDDSGTWIASSYCFCTATDFARFGSLYLHDGKVGITQVLEEDWVATARTQVSADAETGVGHSAHWWIWDPNPWGAYNCSGYEGQYIIVAPGLDAVLVRLGQTPTELRPHVRAELTEILHALDRSRG